MYPTVLVPTDGSDESFRAAAEAVDIVASDGTMHALGVIEEIPMYKRSGKAIKFDDRDEGAEARTRAAVDHVSEVAAEAGIECVTAVERGVPALAITDYAEAVNADAIVLGKRGLNESANDLLGSTTERVLKKASTTVISVPAA